MSGSWPEYRQNIIVVCRNPALQYILKFPSSYNPVLFNTFQESPCNNKFELRLSQDLCTDLSSIYVLFGSESTKEKCLDYQLNIVFRRDLLECSYVFSQRVYVRYEHRGRKESFSSHSNALCCLHSLITNIPQIFKECSDLNYNSRFSKYSSKNS